MKKTLLLSLLVVILATACNKKDKTMSKTDILTSGSWKLSALVEDDDGDGTFETDLYVSFAACQKDDIITFQTSGQVVTDEGPSKCSPSDPQSETEPWQFANNEASLVISGETFSIEELNTSTLRIKQLLPGFYGVMVTLTKR